jgi:acetyltransferase-like isoleucine patch superfamily enzyme
MAAQQKDQQQLQLARSLNHIPWAEEYEKMISGMLYDSMDPSLSAPRFKARRWCHDYNTTFPEGPDANFDTVLQDRLPKLKSILGYVGGDDAFIEPPFRVDYGCNVSIGAGFYANFNLTILDCALVTIGNTVMMGPNVSILAATHETDVQSRRNNIEYAKPVVIGDDCWIGGHVVILPGVTIGQGCTIGASSVVTRDIPAWSVAMGSPARVVKKVTPIEGITRSIEGSAGDQAGGS